MAKTYIAQSVSKNATVNVNADEAGAIQSWVLTADVNYGVMGQNESLDIWPLLTGGQKTTLQNIYNKMSQLFSNNILG